MPRGMGAEYALGDGAECGDKIRGIRQRTNARHSSGAQYVGTLSDDADVPMCRCADVPMMPRNGG